MNKRYKQHIEQATLHIHAAILTRNEMKEACDVDDYSTLYDMSREIESLTTALDTLEDINNGTT